MSNRAIPSTFLKSVLQNGVGRYVGQLQRVTFKFCKEQAGSKGMRDFMQNKLIDFTRSNEGTAVYTQVRRHRNPVIVAEYLNGEVHSLPVPNKSEGEIEQWLDWLRTRSGVPLLRVRKYQHTDNSSIQGTWTPVTNRSSNINIKSFPDKELSTALEFEPSVTQILQKALQQSSDPENDNNNPV